MNLSQKNVGRFILPDSLKICWGTAVSNNQTGMAVAMFPVTHTSPPLVVANMSGMNGNTSIIAAMIGGVTTGQANIYLTYYNGSQLAAAKNLVNWIAIGY